MWACGHGDQSDKAWGQGKWNFPCVHHVFMPWWSRIHVHSCYMFYFGSLYWVPLKVRTLQTCRFFSLQSDLSFFLVFQRFTTVSRFSHDSFCARASRCKWQTLGIVWIGFQCLASSEFTWVDSVCSLSLRVSLSAWRVLHGDVGPDAGAILVASMVLRCISFMFNLFDVSFAIIIHEATLSSYCQGCALSSVSLSGQPWQKIVRRALWHKNPRVWSTPWQWGNLSPFTGYPQPSHAKFNRFHVVTYFILTNPWVMCIQS